MKPACQFFLTLMATESLLPISAFCQSLAQPTGNEAAALLARMDGQAQKTAAKVIAWRRDIHQHPELGSRGFKTAETIAAHLRPPGMKLMTGAGKTGVTGLLKVGHPGPVVAIRADMDALPSTEINDLPFKLTVTTEYNGKTTGVMHACGQDTHVAMLKGTNALSTWW